MTIDATPFRPSSLRPGAVFLAGLAILVWGTQALGAQDLEPIPPMAGLSEECNLDDFRVISSQETGPGDRVTHVGAPDLSCPDGTRIQADSAILYQGMGLSRLMGDVRYDSPERSLRSQNADYYEHNRRLFAEGDVEFTDLLRGVRLFGDELDYLSAYEDRPEERVSVRGDSPRALIPPEGPDGEPDLEAEPWEVEGDHLQFEGERYFWADGNARLLRDDVEASADNLTFDQDTGELVLERSARLLSPDYDLTGGRIVVTAPGDDIQEARATEEARLAGAEYDLVGDTLHVHPPDEEGRREIHAFVDAQLQQADADIVGDEIRIFLDGEALERLVALQARDPEAADDEDVDDEPQEDPERDAEQELVEEILQDEDLDPQEDLEAEELEAQQERDPRARITMEELEMRADSLSILAPNQVLETVVGVGRARGETVAREAPDWEDAPEFLRRDFIEGDTVMAHFIPVPEEEVAKIEETGDPAPSTSGSHGGNDPSGADPRTDEEEYLLETLEALGNARTLYRLPPGVRSPGEDPADPDAPDEPPDASPDGDTGDDDGDATDEGGDDGDGDDPPEGDDDPEDGTPWGVSYVLADRIWIGMEAGDVDRMEARGNVDGVHLEPRLAEEDPDEDPEDGDPDGEPDDDGDDGP